MKEKGEWGMTFRDENWKGIGGKDEEKWDNDFELNKVYIGNINTIFKCEKICYIYE